MDTRKEYIDIAKGIAILCVIAGHTFSDVVCRFIYSFHMPLFFILSGYFFDPGKGLLKDKVIRYLKPYLFTCVILLVGLELKFLIAFFIGKRTDISFLGNLRAWLLSSLYGSAHTHEYFGMEFPYVGAIRFLPALVCAIILLTGLTKYIKDVKSQIAAVLALFILGIISSQTFWLPLSFQSGMSALLFMYVGFWFAKLEKMHERLTIEKCRTLSAAFVLWAIGLLSSYKSGNLDISSNCFPSPLFNVLGACGATIFIVIMSKKLLHVKIISDCLSLVGKYSLAVFCLHFLEMSLLPWSMILNPSFGMSGQIMCFFLRIVICVMAVRFVSLYTCLDEVFTIKRNRHL